MDTRSIASVLLKIAGLVLIGACVTQLPSYFPARLEPGQWSAVDAVIGAGLTVGPALLLGLCLWFFPGAITNKIVAEDPGASAPFEFRVALLVAIVVLGLFLIAHGTVDVVYNVVTLVRVQRMSASLSTAGAPPTIVAAIVASAVEVAIGLAFCMGRRGLARLVESARR